MYKFIPRLRNILFFCFLNVLIVLDVHSDDTQNLQDLINQNITDRTSLKLEQDKIYHISNGLIIDGPLEIDGNGSFIILDCYVNDIKSMTNKNMIFIRGVPDEKIKNITIKNLNLDQNLEEDNNNVPNHPLCFRSHWRSMANMTENAGKGRAIKVAYANNVTIKDVVINNTYIGLEFADGTSDATALRVNVNNVFEDGFEVTINIDFDNPISPKYITLDDTHVKSVIGFDSGFEIEAAKNVTVINSSVNNCGGPRSSGVDGDGVVLKLTHIGTRTLPIINNDITIKNFCSRVKSGDQSISIEHGENIKIIDNAILNGQFEIRDWSDIHIIGNYFGTAPEVEEICMSLPLQSLPQESIYRNINCSELR